MSRLPLVSPVDRVLFLKAQGYLRGLPTELLSALALYTEERYYAAGSLIREGGARVDRIYFLGQGRVSIDDPETSRFHANEVAAPAIIGLAHYFADVTSAPTVRASVDTICLELDVGDLEQILEDHFSLVFQFARRSALEGLVSLQGLGNLRPSEDGFDSTDLHETPLSLNLVHRLSLARRMPFLREANLVVLGQLIEHESPELIHAEQALWRAGDPVDSIALVLDGSFRLIESGGDVHAPSGAVLGIWEILSQEPRREGWVAETPSRVLRVRRDLFTDLLEDHYEFALAYLRYTARKTIATWHVRDQIAQDNAAGGQSLSSTVSSTL